MKKRIAECFVGMVADSPDPSKRISVTALITQLGIDRKTFYNHFDNTTDLVIWIYRSELADALKGAEFYRAQLDYPSAHLYDKYPNLPCYARFPSADGMMDQSPVFKQLYVLFTNRPEYYRHIFTYPCYIDFYRYLEELAIPLMRQDILIMLGEDNRKRITDQQIDFLAEYHAIGLWGRVRHYFSYRNQQIPEEGLDLLWNYAHETVRASLDRLLQS